MPPPLSAYSDFVSASDSDSCPPTAQSIGSRVAQGESAADAQPPPAPKASKAASKKRKGNALPADTCLRKEVAATCDKGDQPVSKGALPRSSASISSLRTRRQTSSVPLYDQKYHPMDDVLRPSRAAKHYARYEDRPADDSEVTDYDEDAVHDRYANKRRKLADETLTGGARRSTRHTNADVHYDMQVHPQDGEIDQEMIDQTDVDGGQDLASSGGDGYFGQEQQVILESDEDTGSEWSSSPPRSSPLSSIALGSVPNLRAPVNGLDFHVYEDSFQTQLHIEASHVVLSFDDDVDGNKENIRPGSEQTVAVDHDNNLAQTAEANVEAVVEEQLDPFEFASNPEVPSTSDSAIGAMYMNQDNIPPQALTQPEVHDEHDSVLGTPTPSPSQSPTRVTIQGGSLSTGNVGVSRGRSHNIELRR